MSSKHEVRQIPTRQKLIVFQRRLPLRKLELSSLHNLFQGCSLHWLNPLQETLQRKLNKIKPVLKTGSFKKHKERNPLAVVDIERTYSDGVWKIKERKKVENNKKEKIVGINGEKMRHRLANKKRMKDKNKAEGSLLDKSRNVYCEEVYKYNV